MRVSLFVVKTRQVVFCLSIWFMLFSCSGLRIDGGYKDAKRLTALKVEMLDVDCITGATWLSLG